MLLRLAIFASVFGSVGLLSWAYCPLGAHKLNRYQSKLVRRSAKRLDNMFIKVSSKKLLLIHTVVPLCLGGLGFLLSSSMLVAVVLGAFGLVLPTIVIKRLAARRRATFQNQLVDGLMILTSSLKGGLSLLQSIEAMVEEMPEPLSQEFSLVLRENKLGIPLDESLEKLNKRMQVEELNLVITAISVARETGGNLPKILNQLVHTIRERNKILGKVKTLTTQGRLQGTIMGLLPIAFVMLVYSMNPNFFDTMLQQDLGKFLIGYAVFSQILGILFIKKFSKVEV